MALQARNQARTVFLVIAKLVVQPSTFAAFRLGTLSVASFVGVWDVVRLLLGKEQPLSKLDLLTCPIVPAMQFVASSMDVSNGFLIWALFCGNAATYAAAGYVFVRWLEHRISNAYLRSEELAFAPESQPPEHTV